VLVQFTILSEAHILPVLNGGMVSK